MNGIDHHREDTADAIRDQRLKVSNRLLLRHLEVKAIAHLQHRLVGLHADVGDVGVDHQREQVEDQVARFAQGGVGREAVLLEGGVVHRRGAAHAFDHFFAELHHGRERLGVAAQDVAEVDVEKVACGEKNEKRVSIEREKQDWGTTSAELWKIGRPRHRRPGSAYHRELIEGCQDAGLQHPRGM